ncbi:TPA: hypothetical protein RZK36_000368 [Campylobacter coli]|nr:hypothetical protein [Campylobacter jejuni]HEB9284929.1 hypothetical protein [Campylobacter coli]HEB9307566.1 hypothetical protein [Campylobacter coli]HEB9322714.1 hypothetical protein [Campylobacter coli]HEB9335672.1 hypothetical protein [Campylobacter coli]
MGKFKKERKKVKDLNKKLENIIYKIQNDENINEIVLNKQLENLFKNLDNSLDNISKILNKKINNSIND